MAFPMLYPDEDDKLVRKSSINQYKDYLSVVTRGGYTPIVFDYIDGINCDTIESHPVIISLGDDLGYFYKDQECNYTSTKLFTFDHEGVVQEPLEECLGGGGEFYEKFVSANAFIGFDDNELLGIQNTIHLRVGTDYVLAKDRLPAVA